jgi:hypothetical protein
LLQGLVRHGDNLLTHRPDDEVCEDLPEVTPKLFDQRGANAAERVQEVQLEPVDGLSLIPKTKDIVTTRGEADSDEHSEVPQPVDGNLHVPASAIAGFRSRNSTVRMTACSMLS